ncbi:hypothetical protein GCM10023232_08710 [Sphingosinicella ginsenosidimutans]
MNVSAIAIVVNGRASASVALAAIVENMAAALVLPWQVAITGIPSVRSAALAMGRGLLTARAMAPLMENDVERLLSNNNPDAVIRAAESAYGVACWPKYAQEIGPPPCSSGASL